ncbi:hypothetical protein [Candidatus Mycoplasma haematohominis]|uniref:Uncharacterized protein n=1 Tax=Candidatus Mycoplasma haematohominis TaxID=1494318 RepID=A0A478FQI9_9MOLU|nr:hypothetical protein [Candidatus Mycoplasma haemohominis]GCE63367.1 hypothetical protein MHSWG343_03630 [Candidatus Mycoplasma haemohominis]
MDDIGVRYINQYLKNSGWMILVWGIDILLAIVKMVAIYRFSYFEPEQIMSKLFDGSSVTKIFIFLILFFFIWKLIYISVDGFNIYSSSRLHSYLIFLDASDSHFLTTKVKQAKWLVIADLILSIVFLNSPIFNVILMVIGWAVKVVFVISYFHLKKLLHWKNNDDSIVE